MIVRTRNCLGAALALVLAGCGGGGGGPPRDENPGAAPVLTIAPPNTGDGWQTSTPAAEGMNGDMLLAALQAVRDGKYPGVDGVVVVKNDLLVAEGYFNGFARDSLHDMRSVGKSVTSALTGIAIEQGGFAIDDPIAQHIAGFDSYDNMDDRKRSITIRNLLNMQTGLECNDWVDSSRGNEERMYDTSDWIKFVLDLPSANTPGTVASYCTGGVVVLGSIIATRSGMELDSFAANYLLNPLNIQDVNWRRSPDGRATGGGGLRLRPRDAAKIGNVYVNGGTWQGARIVPEAWVQQSRQRVTTLGGDGYGLLWWKRNFYVRGALQDSTFASGNGGNFIFQLEAERLVVVFTQSNYNSPRGEQAITILRNYILPAVL